MSITASPPPRTARSSAPPWHQRLTVGHRENFVGPDAIDIAIALACFAVFTGPLLVGMTSGIGSMPEIAGFGVAATAPLIVRRRLPLAVLVAVSAVLCAAALADVRFTPWVSNTGPVIGVAVLTVADMRPRRESIIATVVATIAMCVAGSIAFHLYPDQDQDFVQPLIALPAWLIGDMLRTRRAYQCSLADQERQRAAEAERRIRAEERLRVSRDVHDLISHTLSMVAVRSGVARLLIDENPSETRRALSAIETASRSALTELRAVLSQIREPGQRDEPAEPGLAEVADLVDGLRHDGLMVEYQVLGTSVDYPALLQTTVYRIVQEALTNVVKHARTDRAYIEIRHVPGELAVSITDDGPRAAMPAEIDSSGSGLGLEGMRQRVSLFGGRFESGPRAAGGFAVTASFPIDRDHHA
ncbi:sensor histidine kinase [Nocardia sp. NPDC004278]